MTEFRHQTARLTLRDWRAEDWPVFWEATNTPAVMRWLSGVQDAAARVAGRRGSRAIGVITVTPSGWLNARMMVRCSAFAG